jgi:putative endonuclease
MPQCIKQKRRFPDRQPAPQQSAVSRQRNADMNWQVYIILCSDESLYTGITTDVERRFAQHLAGTGAKYFRGRSPCCLVYLELGHDRSSASRREAEIKGLRSLEKRRLLAAPNNRVGETACGGGPS